MKRACKVFEIKLIDDNSATFFRHSGGLQPYTEVGVKDP
jgi:hypothetical protein